MCKVGDMRFNSIIPIILISSLTALATDLPRPLADHPGNIFVAGERVVVPTTAPAGNWKLSDYDRVSKDVAAADGKIDLGNLPVGYYELRRDKDPGRITVGVIAPLAAPTPPTSP